MFLEMRREAVERGQGEFAEHNVIVGYERRGTSKRYTYYALPQDCDTVLFPGCTLPGTRPDKVKALFNHLQESIPTIGVVLDCCTKPSHDLGRDKHFQEMFTEMRDYLLHKGVKNVLVACPNCYRVFKQYGEKLHVKTIYEHVAESKISHRTSVEGTVTIHDPCGTRNETSIHESIRQIARNNNLKVEEMKHAGEKTICCGEGGSVGCMNPEFSKGWSIRRKDEAQKRRILTYCAGCANYLGSVTPTSHVLDLLFEPEATMAGKAKISKAPITYWNRIRLKQWFKNTIQTAHARERTFTGGNSAGRTDFWGKIGILSLLVATIIAIRITGATQYLEQEKLRTLIEASGTLAPIIYMLIYAIAPALFLPGLPITIAGGILFGPFWGVIYTIFSATAGACVAFLASRYLGRDWIKRKLTSPRWKKLDEMVEIHGWKAVALTRFIPLFPFNLLNYAFGLTNVKFSHYAIATFFCMLPACIAFIVFSSSLLEVIKGNVTPTFFIGLLLIASVSSIPFIYNKMQAKGATSRNKI